jgi:hypothetical protein
VAGEDSLQSLVLALELLQNTLPSLARRKGGEIEWLGEHERLVFAGSEQRMWQWTAVSNLVDGIADAIKALEARPGAPKALPARLRALVASCGASTKALPRSRSPRKRKAS